MSFHKVVIEGRLGSDPESRFTPSGTQVTNFSVATDTYVSKREGSSCPDGWKESYSGKGYVLTTWWKVSAWGKLAEIANQHLAKGREVYIEGEVTGTAVNGSNYPRIWNASDGTPRASFEVRANEIQFIGSRSDNGQAEAPAEESPEIPF
jgi:single-strand DNA-binding protein